MYSLKCSGTSISQWTWPKFSPRKTCKSCFHSEDVGRESSLGEKSWRTNRICTDSIFCTPTCLQFPIFFVEFFWISSCSLFSNSLYLHRSEKTAPRKLCSLTRTVVILTADSFKHSVTMIAIYTETINFLLSTTSRIALFFTIWLSSLRVWEKQVLGRQRFVSAWYEAWCQCRTSSSRKQQLALVDKLSRDEAD